jgi:hypothetical protein
MEKSEKKNDMQEFEVIIIGIDGKSRYTETVKAATVQLAVKYFGQRIFPNGVDLSEDKWAAKNLHTGACFGDMRLVHGLDI